MLVCFLLFSKVCACMQACVRSVTVACTSAKSAGFCHAIMRVSQTTEPKVSSEGQSVINTYIY